MSLRRNLLIALKKERNKSITIAFFLCYFILVIQPQVRFILYGALRFKTCHNKSDNFRYYEKQNFLVSIKPKGRKTLMKNLQREKLVTILSWA